MNKNDIDGPKKLVQVKYQTPNKISNSLIIIIIIICVRFFHYYNLYKYSEEEFESKKERKKDRKRERERERDKRRVCMPFIIFIVTIQFLLFYQL